MQRAVGSRLVDSPPSSLQRVHDPAVLRKIERCASLSNVEQRVPEFSRFTARHVEKPPNSVEDPGENGMTDGVRPDLAGLDGSLIIVSQGADPCRGVDRGLGV